MIQLQRNKLLYSYRYSVIVNTSLDHVNDDLHEFTTYTPLQIADITSITYCFGSFDGIYQKLNFFQLNSGMAGRF